CPRSFLCYTPRRKGNHMSQLPLPQQMAAERERIGKLKAELNAKIAEFRSQLEDLDIELHAITAYERAKAGKASAPSTGTRIARGTKRSAVLTIISNNPGLTRGEIIDRMGIKGQKSEEQALSNMLANLKKYGNVTAEAGKYAMVTRN
ncbi:MAG: hypothetical protein U1E21_19570, partial [Reyranellaceae bacterium]